MRRWLLIVMIALLPLRVWAGDVMAGQMLAQQLGAINSVAISAHPEQTAGHFHSEMAPQAHADCLGHAAVADDTDEAAAGMDCSTCVACQVCHSVALMVVPAQQAALPAWHDAPASRALPFASAPVALGFKPPIS